MAEINQNYLYTDSNLWVEVKGNIERVGIDDYSQDEFGEIVYVDLP
ncbi:glycine cleavage system protein H, partial [Francisella tularensis subsp. holarctica]|nr:glycine cleavage system protein H [Francisella tularensis subsp. holarctica]